MDFAVCCSVTRTGGGWTNITDNAAKVGRVGAVSLVPATTTRLANIVGQHGGSVAFRWPFATLSSTMASGSRSG